MKFEYESFVGPIARAPFEVPTETYKSNVFVAISEEAQRFEIEKYDVRNYKLIQKIVHPNILCILHVDETDTSARVIYSNCKKGDVLCPLEEALCDPFFDADVLNDPYSNANIKLLMHDLMNGLVALHTNGLHHGNLSMATVYFYLRKNSRRPVFKLGKFKRNRLGPLLAMVQDWKDVGRLLENLMDRIYGDWRTNYLYREFVDLCDSLKHDAMGINTNYKRCLPPGGMSEQCRQYVIEHPGMFDVLDRTSYILSACTFIEKAKLETKIKDEDFDAALTVDGSLIPELIAQGSIGNVFLTAPPGRKGAVYVIMVRNLLGHQPLTGILQSAFGTTSIEIEGYFREHQPNLVLVLYKVVKGTTFNFESFVTMNPEAYLLN